MADDTVKRLLVKLGISTNEWKAAVREIQDKLKEVNSEAIKQAKDAATAQKDQIKLTKEQIADQQRLAAESKAMAAFDQAKAAWQKQQQEVLKTKLAQQVLETAELKKQAAQETIKVKLEQEELRLAQMRLRLQQQHTREQERQTRTGGERGSGGIGGALGAFAGVLGGGPVGMIAAGASIGNVISEGASKILENTIESIKRLGEAMMEATGPAAQLREQFEKLTKRAGEDPDEYLTKLRVATRGLADDVNLYRIANNYMQQGLNVTSEDVVKLIGNTVSLARAQGKDATTAVQALERASKTGRTQILAMVTGLTRQELQLKGVSNALDATTRKTMEFNQVQAAMEARLKAIGTPATTLPEIIQHLHNVQKNFVDDLAIAVTKSQGYKDAISELSKVLFDLEPILERIVKALARVTDLFELATPFVKMFVSYLKIGYEINEAWTKLLGTLLNFSVTFDSIFKGSKADAFRQFVGQVAMGFLNVSQYGNEAAIKIHAFGEELQAVLKMDFSKLDEIGKQKQKDIEASRQTYLHDALGIAKFGMGIDEETPAAKPQTNIDPNAIARERQIQKLELELTRETNKLLLDETMERLKAEQEAVKQSYDQGVIDLQGKVAREKQIYMQEHAARLRQIEEDRKATIENIIVTGKEQMIPQRIIDLQVANANRKAQDERTKSSTTLNQQIGGLDESVIRDQQAAYQKYTQELMKIAQQGVQERTAVLEKEFSEGRVDADKYLMDKRDLINQEYLATKDGLDKQLAQFGLTEKQKQDIQSQEINARMKAEKELTLLVATENQTRLKYEENRFNLQKRLIESQIKGARTQRGFGGAQEEGALTQVEVQATQEHISNLEKLRSDQSVKEGSEEWFKYTEQIQAANTQLVELQLKLIQMKSLGGPLAGLSGAFGGLFEAFPRSRTAAGIASAFGVGQQAVQEITPFTQGVSQAGGIGNYVRGMGSSFRNLFDRNATKSVDTGVLDEFGNKMKEVVKIPFAEKFSDFAKNLGDTIGAIRGLIKGVTSGQTGGEGALSGAQAGAQFGAAFGPWGALIGAGAGASFGAIFGAKNKELQQEIHKIQAQLNSIVSDLQSGTISLNQALQDLRSERQQAIQTLSQGSVGKKGGKGGAGAKKGLSPTQAQAVIQQIDTQIQQLVNEQTMLLQQLHSSLMELSTPVQFQEYVQSLDTIIQKYEQFASAAQGNAQEVAAANQYLNESLQQYVYTLSQQLNQAQQQAIQDALTLINLEYQRQQLINQEAQSEYDILSSGVLTRQRTTAMTKGQEIGVLRYQRDMQLQQMNEEIALAQAKVAAETKIFGLANTRIGLETQLLAAQEEQANYQIAQVQALAQIVASLSGGLASGQTMQQITQLMAGGNLPTGPSILYTLLQELGLGSFIPPSATGGQYGTQNWLAGIPSTDVSAAQYVASLDPQFPYYILGKNYAAAAADAQQYVSQGNVEGYNMSGLINWLDEQGGGNSGGGGGGGGGRGGGGRGYAEGGPVNETGQALLHAGEWVLPKPVVNLLKMFGSNPPTSIMPGASSGTDRVGVEQTITDLTSNRVDMEMQIVTARTNLLNNEMQYLQALTDLQNNMPTGSAGDLEALLQRTYETRGRYGSGGFRREYL